MPSGTSMNFLKEMQYLLPLEDESHYMLFN